MKPLKLLLLSLLAAGCSGGVLFSDARYREDGELGSYLAATYPQINLDAAGDQPGAALNELVREKVLAQLGRWREDVIVDSRRSMEGMKTDPSKYGASHRGWRCEITYQKGHIRHDSVSLCLKEYWHTGGAHGNWNFHPLNYWWVGDGFQEVQLTDLFVESATWREQLDALIWEGYLALLAERVEDEEYLAKVQREAESLDGIHKGAPFCFSEEGIVFFYAPYCLHAFSFGDFRVFVPWNRLEPLLDPEGPGKACRSN